MARSTGHERPPTDQTPGRPSPGARRAPVKGAPKLVGRRAETDAVVEGLRAAFSGRAPCVMISGEAGVGKTALASAAAERFAATGGAAVLWGRCFDETSVPPFWPWLEVLRGMVEIPGLDEGQRRAAIGLLEARDPEGEGLRAGSAEGADIARLALFEHCAQLLCEASWLQPIVVALDDVQEADEPSLLLLRHLLRRTDGAWAFLLTRRDGPVQPGTREALLGDVVRESLLVRLEGLSQREAARLLLARSGRRLGESVLQSAWKKTAGNPLFLELLGGLLRRDLPVSGGGETATIAFPIPGELRDVVARRLLDLPAHARSALDLAAVFGEEFDLPLLVAATALLRRSTLEAGAGSDAASLSRELLDALDRLRASGLIEGPVDATGWRFGHGILRDTVYESIPTGRRLELHATIAQACEDVDPELGGRLDQASHHALLAAPLVGARRPLELLLRRANLAIRNLAHESARSILTQAASLARSAGEIPHLCDVLTALGEAQLRGGSVEEAQQSLEEAVTIARVAGDMERLGSAAIGLADVATGLPLDLRREARVGRLLEEALCGVPAGDSPLRSALLTRSAALLFLESPEEERRASAEAGLAMARRIGDPSLVGHALCDIHAALWRPENTQTRLGWSSEALRLARVASDDALALRAHSSRILALLEFGDPIALDVEIPALDDYARRLGEPRFLWLATHMRALAALVRGRFEEAERLATQAYGYGERVRDPRALSFLSLVMEVTRLHQGRLAEFEPMIRANVFDGDDLSVRLGIGLLAAELDRPVEARGVLDSVRRSGRVELPGDPRARSIMAAALAQTIAFVGDAQAAGDLREMLLPVDGLWVTAQHLGTMIDAPASYYLGILEDTAGLPAEALAHLEQSLEACERLGAGPARARTLLALGRVLCRSGEPSDAEKGRAALEEAERLARELGMELVHGRALSELERFDGPPPSPGRYREAAETSPATAASPSQPGNDAVFRREGDVWRVSFKGRDALFPHLRGFEMICALLGRPHEPISCPELQSAALGPVVVSGYREFRLDRKALASYRERLVALQGDLEEADALNDAGRRESLSAEIDFLRDEIASSVGIAGRRRMSGDSERARVNVRRAIALALSRLASHEELSAHLDRTIKTGSACSYEPPFDAAIEWVTGPAK